MNHSLSKSIKHPRLILAPMAGITDLPFRLVCKEYGADVVYSEMISATGMFYEQNRKIKKSLALAQSISTEKPIVLQLFGSVPEHYAFATKLISALPDYPQKTGENFNHPLQPGLFRPAGIDINFGCPVKKVMKQGAGCALMRNPTFAKDIIKAVLDNTNLPVSIKIRAGIETINALQFLETVADLNWQTVMIHGRTYSQGFSGSIDLGLIKKIKEAFPQKKLIINGGITNPEIAKDMVLKTDCDGLAIGRGVLGAPWIFRQIKESLTGKKIYQPSTTDIKNTIINHAQYLQQLMPLAYLPEFQKHLSWYCKGFPGSKMVRQQLNQINSYAELYQLLDLL